MARSELYREDGPGEMSGLIHFGGYAPGRCTYWRMTIHVTDGDALVRLTSVNGEKALTGTDLGGIVMPLEELRDMLTLALDMIPGRQQRGANVLRRQVAKV